MTKSLPEWLEPMAATLTQERFTGPEWIFERKFDGIRLLAFKEGTEVQLFSRNRLPQNIPRDDRGPACQDSDGQRHNSKSNGNTWGGWHGQYR